MSPPESAVSPARMAAAVRALSMDAVERAQSGHPGMPMGMADVATVLFTRFLKHDPARPDWPDRDRFVLSAGHGSMLLYALLHLTGYADMTLEELKNFRQLGARTAGHPEYGHAPGIETTTGPLGQGLGNAVGMAMAERLLAARHGDALVGHHTYVIAGDGCLMEGVSHEAASLAGHLRLGRLIVLHDDNRISIDGSTDLACSDDTLARFRAYGWDARAVDGHDPEAVAAALSAARETSAPSLIACRTTIGFGAPGKGGTAAAHGAPLGAEEVMAARAALDWPHPPFEIPDDVLSAWRAAGGRGAADRAAWEARHKAAPEAARVAFDRDMAGALPADWEDGLRALRREMTAAKPKLATRQASQKALSALAPALPALVGGSADLTGSNGSLAEGMAVAGPGAWDGRYIHYGVREHGMAAAMNGMALHGGVIPYGASFLIFTDYCRPAIRLAALMRQRVIHVMTHDSIGLGEDGPTHQPVEQLASLRAIPNLNVFRPCDAVETAECWSLAARSAGTPSVLSLTRQGVPTLRDSNMAEGADENLCARGGYVLREAEGGPRMATLVATGSEVAIAVAARDILRREGVPAAVVSMPCLDIFAVQDDGWRAAVLGDAPRVVVEAAIRQGWEGVLRPGDLFVGMEGFGASAPAPVLYEHFGITPDAVADAARAIV